MYRLADTLHLRRHHVAGAITRKDRDVALLQPGHHGNMQPRESLPGIPRSLGGAASPASSAHEYRIAASDFHTGLLLPRLDVFDIDRSARLHIRNPLEPRNVDQNASRDDAVLISGDVVLH